MSRKYRYESVQMPQGTNNDVLTVDDHPTRFLPGGLTLTVAVQATGDYTILIKAGPAAAASSLYVDPDTGATVFTVPRAFRLPPCRSVSVVLNGVGENVIPFLGGITYSGYE